jgi:hypothetical protein
VTPFQVAQKLDAVADFPWKARRQLSLLQVATTWEVKARIAAGTWRYLNFIPMKTE